ncbi:type III secretion system chaperone [Parashewanella curva]|nr:type III secretion system chaperone [Parashewanella curva]
MTSITPPKTKINYDSKSLVSALFEYAGMPKNDIEDSSCCIIQVDEQSQVIINWYPNIIKLVCPIGKLCESNDEIILMKLLLEQNVTSCSRFTYQYSLDPEKQELVLSVILSTDNFIPNSFIEFFLNFVQDAQTWIEQLNAQKFFLPDLINAQHESHSSTPVR